MKQWKPRWAAGAIALLGLTVSLSQPACCHSRCVDSAASAPQPRRLALLVGITGYSEPVAFRLKPTWPNLTGAEDVDLLDTVLTSPPWSLSPGDVVKLMDHDATLHKIKAEFRALTARAQPGDVALIYFGGHGQQIVDGSNNDPVDELDGLDESFVPWDYIANDAMAGNVRNLRDDDLGVMLDELRKKVGDDGSVTIVMDTCHSGTGTRLINAVRGRGWDNLLDGGPPPPANPAGQRKGPSGMFALGQPKRDGFALLAAAAAGQEANPAYFPEYTKKEGVGKKFEVLHGALTGALAMALFERGPGITYRELFDRVSALVAVHVRTGKAQDPQLEGVIEDRPFLSRSAALGVRHLLVTGTADDGSSIELPVGAAHGATRGSRFGIYRPCLAGEGEKIAEAEIESVDSFVSRARISGPLKKGVAIADLKNAWAMEQAHSYESQPLMLLLSPGTALPGQLGRAEFLKATTSLDQQFDFSLRHDDHGWIIERVDQTRVALIIDGPNAEELLRRKLLQLWRWSYLARLDTPGTAQVAAPAVRIVPIGAAQPPPEGPPAGGMLSFNERTQVTIELSLPAAPDPKAGAKWVSLLQLSPDGDIAQIFPLDSDASSGPLDADGKWHRLDIKKYTFETQTPGRYFLKAIATTTAVDFGALMDPGSVQKRDLALARAPLELSALALLFSAGAEDELPTQRVALAQWSTTQIAFDVLPAGGRP
jgi:hypothetical protein